MNVSDLRNISQQSDGDTKITTQKKRLNAFVSYSLGECYEAVVKTTTLTQDGRPLDVKDAETVLSTWCARRRQDQMFTATVANNVDLIKQDIMNMEPQTKFLSAEDLATEARTNANLRIMRMFLSTLPCIPKTFEQDGHVYTIVTSTDRKRNINWIIPDDEKKTTCKWSNVQSRDQLTHYWDRNWANQQLKQFVQDMNITLQPSKEGDNKVFTLTVMGKPIVEYRTRVSVEGQANILDPIF